MTNFPMCIACLSSNIRLCLIKDAQLSEIYEKLTNITLFKDNVIPKTMCYICYTQLQKCYKFINMSQKAAKILMQLLNNGIQLTQETVSALNEKTTNNLVKIVLNPTSVPPINFYDEKLDESPSNNINENITETYADNKSDFIQKTLACMNFKEELKEIDEQTSIEEEAVIIKEEPMEVEFVNKKECMLIKKQKVRGKQVNKKFKTALKSKIEGKNINAAEVHAPSMDDNNLLKPQKIKYTKKRTRHGKEKNHDCNICDMKFSCKAYLMRHSRIHTGERPFSCKTCDKTFAQSSHLIQHMRLHTGEKPFICHICENKAFNHRYNYKTHMRKHFGVPTHTCHLCSSVFHQKGDLKRHIMSHTGERPYPCSTCNMKFTQNCHLTKHMKRHTEKSYSCSRCKKEFSHKLDYNSHMSMHKVYTCSIQGCSKSFNRKGMLTNHVKAHTNEKLYNCDKCDKTFRQKGRLTKHYNLFHPNTQSMRQNETVLLNQEDVKPTQVDLQNHQDNLREHSEEYIIP